MAMIRHPITGVAINEVDIIRTSFTFEEAVTIWVMKLTGEKFALIAQKMGANTMRIGEVLRGDKHPEAKAEAMRRLAH